MELRHLRYFQAVAEELSFARAARRLRISQPALSRAVKEIEAELGADVLERSRHFVRLTPAGAALLREAAVLLERWEEANRRVKRAAAGEEGELRLGYIGPPTQAFLGRALAEFRRRFPRVAVHLEERTPERTWEMVAKGRLSVALTRPVQSEQAEGLKTVTIAEERLGAIVPAGHAWAGRENLQWRDLADEGLIVLARREGVGLHDTTLAACRRAGFAPRIAQTPTLIGTVLCYVEAGAGIAVAPASVITGTPLKYVPLAPAVHVQLVLVWPENEDTPAVQRFRELLLEWKAAGKLFENYSAAATSRKRL